MIRKIGLFFAAVFLLTATVANAVTLINGAGGTFPYPIYSKWFDAYTKVDPTVRFNYQPIGSGGGIQQITAMTVDFGASDKFLSDAQLRAVPGKLLHIPTVMGAVVVTYNIPGFNGSLRLTPDVLADIYLGKISKWNDSRIAATNPRVPLPNQFIVVVHRSDGSGTTSIFTNYLCSVSGEWAKRVGTDTSVAWPVGLGGKGNAGVAGQVKNTRYSIGYVELAYAIENRLPFAALRNRSGVFVEPSIASTTAAAASVRMPADFRINLVNQPGRNAYPIVGLTWLLVYQNQKDKLKGRKLVEFLRWSMRDGEKMAKSLLYSPLPPNVIKMVERTISTIR
ncbi:MAG: phosphate ABC transporter substrate-binding protein PstS [Desulfuromonadales bacterium]|nr:phosphate ABC transporter substrate-binding protein PstS [Desulfuromonadales bacterium]